MIPECFHSPGKGDFRKAGAVCEGAVSDRAESFGKVDACKAFAAKKCKASDFCNLSQDRYCGKRAAAGKHIGINKSKAGRQDDFRKAFAVCKRTVGNFGQPFRQYEF